MVLTGVMNLRRHLAAGVTTIREHGARNRVGFAIREGLQRGYYGGPRMLVSGRPITRTGGHFHFCNETADGVDEVRRSVQRLVREGADYIKVMASGGGTEGTIPSRASYTTDELHAVRHEAHHLGVLTAAHCRAGESMRRAVEAGIDLIEHAEFLEEGERLVFDPKLAEQMGRVRDVCEPDAAGVDALPADRRADREARSGHDHARRIAAAGRAGAAHGNSPRHHAPVARLRISGPHRARDRFGPRRAGVRAHGLRPATPGANGIQPRARRCGRRRGWPRRRQGWPTRSEPSSRARLPTWWRSTAIPRSMLAP